MSMTDNIKFTGIVLTGGKSKRMGRDKSLLKLGDKSFLEVQLEKLVKLNAKELIISEASDPLETPLEPDYFNYYREKGIYIHEVKDKMADKGPLAGLYSSFLEAKEDTALVLSVDVPLVKASTLKELLISHAKSKAMATVLVHNKKYEPLIAVYDTGNTEILKELIDSEKLAIRAFLDRIKCNYYEFFGNENELLNCNSPDDLKSLTKP
ncbi:MAG: molybdenum cofactor guanylyltransferase [Lachnospiraceae bacterium]|nr:molybdenum cofactor guanylyltransferase [Lachnospiraceae bacterium]